MTNRNTRLKWRKWDSYEIVQDSGGLWLHPSGKLSEEYDAFDTPSLTTELVRLNRAGTKTRNWIRAYTRWRNTRKRNTLPQPPDLAHEQVEAVLQFAKTFGHLGWTELNGGPRRAVINGKSQLADGDPLAWFLKHAENVDLAMTLGGHLAKLERLELGTLLNDLAEAQERIFEFELRGVTHREGNFMLYIPTLTSLSAEPLANVRQLLTQFDEMTVTRKVLSALLTPNLTGVIRVIDPTTGTSTFHFKALIQVVYWQLADVLGTESLRRCRCGLWFFARNAKQEYCSALPKADESACAKRYRMRRFRTQKSR